MNTFHNIVEKLDSLNESQLLENSSLFYITHSSANENAFKNKLRYDDSIATESLLCELDKVLTLQSKQAGVVTEKCDFFNLDQIESVTSYVGRKNRLNDHKKSEALVTVAGALTSALCKAKNSRELNAYDNTIDYVVSQMKDETASNCSINQISNLFSGIKKYQELKCKNFPEDATEKEKYDKIKDIADATSLISMSSNGELRFEEENMGTQVGTIESTTASYRNLLESVISRRLSTKALASEMIICALEHDCFPDLADMAYGDKILEALTIEEVQSILEFEDCREFISPKGLCKMSQLIVDPCSPIIGDVDMCRTISNTIKDKLANTLRHECGHYEYSDVPMTYAIDASRDYLKAVFSDLEDTVEEIDDLFDEIGRHLEYVVQREGLSSASYHPFNPNPFNVYQLTPFDSCGVRTMQRSLLDVFGAETDDEMEEALENFGRLVTAIEVTDGGLYNPVEEGIKDALDDAAKSARQSVKKAGRKVNSFARRTGKNISDATYGAKKAVDPVAKFITATADKMRKLDMEERRNIVIKGGGAGAFVGKILRWLKRGIGLVVVGSFGPVGAIISGISLVTFVATDVQADEATRAKVLRELEDELAIVEEKIEDSKGDENRQKKYELMRIRNKLKSDIDRIRLRLKY